MFNNKYHLTSQELMSEESHSFERGQSMVELAISFTMLMMMLSATVDIGRAFYAYIAIRDAAQEGAAYGSLNPTDVDGIIEHVRHSSTDPFDLTDVASVTVWVWPEGYEANKNNPGSWPASTTCAGNGLQVQVIYDLNMMMPLITMIIPSGEIALTANMLDTILSPPC